MGGHKRCYFTGAAERLREGISTRAVMVDMLRPAVPRVDYHNDDGDDDAFTMLLMALMILMTGSTVWLRIPSRPPFPWSSVDSKLNQRKGGRDGSPGPFFGERLRHQHR